MRATAAQGAVWLPVQNEAPLRRMMRLGAGPHILGDQP
jgi:hypothetical protein